MIYYKVKDVDYNDDLTITLLASFPMFANEINYATGEKGYDVSNYNIGPGGALINVQDTFKLLAFGCKPYIKIIKGIIKDSTSLIKFEGSIEQIINELLAPLGISINIYDYIEEITKEEFYNLNN